MTIATGKLTGSGLSILQEKVDKLNKRAARLGLEPMVLRSGPPERVVKRNPTGLDSTILMYPVELSGCAPRIDGWIVAARIEFTDSGNLVHVAPNAGSVNPEWRTIGNQCDHCNTQRRRNDLIVIRNIDGREKVVGRNCLADYLRTADAEAMVEYAAWLSQAGRMISDSDDEFERCGGQRVAVGETIETVVKAASICIRKLGWRSGSTAFDYGGSSTKNDVCALLYPPIDGKNRREWEKWIEDNDLHMNDYDADLAGKAIAWAQSLEPGQSEYLHNLKILANSEWIGTDKFGYVVSIIPAYNREMEKEMARKEYAKKKGEKVYFGEKGKRSRKVRATCKGVRSFEGNYGVTTMVRFEHYVDDSHYAVLVWFASGDRTEEFEVDEEYTFDATIKGHDDHETYGKQTKINRVTVKG